MGVMGLWFVFGGGGGYCFRLSPGRGSGLTGRGFWPCLLGLGGCGVGGTKSGAGPFERGPGEARRHPAPAPAGAGAAAWGVSDDGARG